ncbi:MAG: hypothetical protein ACRC7O_11415 [Fimbriiglobus sp.]
MAYGDFTLTQVEVAFGLRSVVAPLFADTAPVPAPAWLRDQLARGLQLPLMSEKMRGELIVMPVLLAAIELVTGPITIYSGVRMDVDPARGLSGECDFVLGRAVRLPEVRAPLLTMVEAKKVDIDLGLGQCAAQMVGARLFNERDGRTVPAIYGCVTTGENWQFLRLAGGEIVIDSRRYFLNELDTVLGVFRTILAPPAAGA